MDSGVAKESSEITGEAGSNWVRNAMVNFLEYSSLSRMDSEILVGMVNAAFVASKIVEKKLIELRECKAVFDSKINAYKLTHTAATGTTPSNSQIEAMKRRLGITI